jgi:hypothetical protein
MVHYSNPIDSSYNIFRIFKSLSISLRATNAIKMWRMIFKKKTLNEVRLYFRASFLPWVS